MRQIRFDEIVDAVSGLAAACVRLSASAKRAMAAACEREECAYAKAALDMLIKNAELAESERLPVCQDTGMACVFVKLGQDVHIEGGLLKDAVDEGVRRGYAKYGCRASVLDPITRVNTGDNTPAILHVELVKGDRMEITLLPKGFGSENMSKLYMLTPAEGIEGVKRSVIAAVKAAGANPCPPIVVGVGIGGTAERAMLTAKEQLLREVGQPSEDAFLADLERQLLDDINALKIGAQGFGGGNTALAVHIGKYPTHIASLPVAVNIQCNAVRLERTVL